MVNDVVEQLAHLNQQGLQLFQEKLYAQALEVLQQVVALTRQHFGEDHPDLGVALLNRGRMYRLLERNAECEADYRQALNILHGQPDGRQEQIIWLLTNLCSLYKNTGRLGEDEPYLRELLTIHRARLPPRDLRLAESLINLADACLAREDSDTVEIVELLREALAIRETILGSNHPQTTELREALTQLGELEDAPAEAAVTAAEGSPSPREQFRLCMGAFIQHDYLFVGQQAMALILSGRITHVLLQILLISLQRTSQSQSLEQIAEQVPEITKEVPWERALVELTLGQTDLNTVLAQAQNDDQRGQAFYYAAARLITDGRSDEVGDLLHQCVQLQASGGIEKILAIEELKFLNNQQPAPPPPQPTVQSVESHVATLNTQAIDLFNQGKVREALPLFQQIAEIKRQAFGENDPKYARALWDLSPVYQLLGELDQAEAVCHRSLEILEGAFGPTNIASTLVRKQLANVFAMRGDMDKASLLYRQVLAEEKATDQHRTAEWVDMALIQGRFCRMRGDLSASETLLRDALEVSQAVLGPNKSSTLQALEELANTLIAGRRFKEAEAYCSELVEARRATVGERHPDYARALEDLALSAFEQGEYSRSETLWREALGVYSEVPEAHAEWTTSVLNQLGKLNHVLGRLTEAESCWRQALDVVQNEASPDSHRIDIAQNSLAIALQDQGKFHESEDLYRQVLERMVATRGKDDPEVAKVQINLAYVLQSQGRFTEAEVLYLQSLDSIRRSRGERDVETAKCLGHLGLLYYNMALYDRAEPLFRQHLAILQEMLPNNNPDLGISLARLGELYRVTDRLDGAESLFNQALAVWRAGVGENHPHVATALNNLALLCMARQDWDRAEELYRQAIDCKRHFLGAQHPDLATSLDTLAVLYRVTGRYKEATQLCREALEMRRALLGEIHPDVAWSLNNLALLRAYTGQFSEALDLLNQSSAVDDRLISQIFAVSSEAQRLVFLDHLRDRMEVFLSLVLQHLVDQPKAVRAALNLVLRRKGLVAEALATKRDAIMGGHYPHLKSALGEVARLRREIARKTLVGPEPGESLAQHASILAGWQAERERLEEQLARSLPEVGLEQQLRHADASVVGLALPAASTLVEFVRIDIWDFHATPGRGQSEWLPPRYLALVLPAGNPEAAVLFDLGEAEVLDQLVAKLRTAVTRYSVYEQGDGDEIGQALRRQLFDPLLPTLSGRTQLFLSPDGALTTLPFEVLPLEDGTRLIDHYLLSYVSTGRDVLRFGSPLCRQPGDAVVAADPDFDLSVQTNEAAPMINRQSGELDRGRRVSRLPGTRAEGEQIASLLGVRPLLGADVVEARFHELHSPVLLHIATHGFFLKNQRGLRPAVGGEAPRLENPLLRSGLLLSGFNAWLSGTSTTVEAEDGILNGEDVSGLDLLDTELAVLSACETGLGDMRIGEGVFGLRRAFVLAGARTLIMSLWKVPDQQTSELMVGFYQSILAGQPRAQALRQAQLAIKVRHPDPVYWAAFICQGDPGPMRWRSEVAPGWQEA